MLDIGWGELFLIGVVALIVVGPKDLPALFRTVGQFTGKARGMAREFQRSLEQAANESGMSEMSKSLRSIDDGLNAATNSARRFAQRPVRTVAEGAVAKATADGVAGPEPAEAAPAATTPVADTPPPQKQPDAQTSRADVPEPDPVPAAASSEPPGR
jgi:sec-independent protein translocase protein TatB